MLSDASSYKFVKTSDVASFINGNIIPAVFPNSNTIATLNFENYLFLLEAYYERNNIMLAGDNTLIPPMRTLNSGNIRALIPTGTYQNYPITGSTSNPEYKPYIDAPYGRWCNPNTTIYPNIYQYEPSSSGGYSSRFWSYVQNFGLYNPIDKQPYYGMRPSKQSLPKAEFIRSMFYAYNMMRKYVRQMRTDILFESANYSVTNYKGETTSTGNIYLGANGGLGTIRRYAIHDNTSYLNYDTTFTSKKYGPFPYAASMKFSVAVEVRNVLGGSTKGYWFTLPIELDELKYLQMPDTLIDDIVNEVCGLASVPTDSCEVQWRDSGLMIDFDFPANLNGVNWNWEPQYT